MADDDVSGQHVMCRDAKALAAGPPCINFSELLVYSKRVDARACVEESTHVSGLVFRQTQEVGHQMSIPTLFYEQALVWHCV